MIHLLRRRRKRDKDTLLLARREADARIPDPAITTEPTPWDVLWRSLAAKDRLAALEVEVEITRRGGMNGH